MAPNFKKLIIGCNKEMLVHNKYDPIHIVPLDDDFDLPTTQLLLFPIHLPNLESLSLEYREGKFDGKLEFLKDNPHIKKLSLPFVEEIPRVFDTIKSFNNLEHLDIFTNCLGYSKELQRNNFPTPYNLKSLTLECFYYPHIIQFVKSFHRITNLKVKTLHIHFNEIIQFINELSDFQLLKNLSLCFVLTSCELEEAKDSKVYMPFKTNDIKLPKLGNLEKVEFKLVSEIVIILLKWIPVKLNLELMNVLN
ncbi:hypothetical protein CONCODRAFT_143245 [Conidiobolus coronatus NRRL 28638]|uniref:F-box domain-containing protein n=1 Tax=Conidiobolus coronatus (strain ATCC 28846 / CBS 209.66 / NRRL 28638) TaxID=796925 RepID=A0A137NRL6_CONC2|nr:hypothetical protein CONCODRAFT_143245 [Conidiobolus coronatus NRRL 28638]|eukprot:KXN65364.1 hypothetical protein CONCODRAFT_143245 [Conidiobolus coronatus NRRL 28638]